MGLRLARFLARVDLVITHVGFGSLVRSEKVNTRRYQASPDPPGTKTGLLLDLKDELSRF